jgi:hypothetical protein
MTNIQDFIANPGRAGEGYLQIKETMEIVYLENALKKTAIHAIIKKLKNAKNTNDQRHLHGKKRSMSRLSSPLLSPPPLGGSLPELEALAIDHGMSVSTIQLFSTNTWALQRSPPDGS